MKKILFVITALATMAVINVMPATAKISVENSCAASLVETVQSLAVEEADACGSGNYKIQIGEPVLVNNWWYCWYYYPAYGYHAAERCYP